MRPHSKPASATISATSVAHSPPGAQNKMGRNRVSSTTAVISLSTGFLQTFRQLVTRATKAPFALVIGSDRLVQAGSIKIRPQCVGKVQLGIGQLPEQKIANAFFSSGADEKIGFGGIGEA